MTTKEKILLLLEQSKSEMLSGEQLASQLLISRNAVWKAIKSLQEQGHKIVAVSGGGYRLERSSDVLSAQTILPYIQKHKNLKITVQEEVCSTNTLLKEWAIAGESHGTVLIADHQTQGRGRRGRAFFSPGGTGIYMSILLRPQMAPTQAALLTAAAAVATAKAIESVCDQQVKIKWVNDLFVREKKCCGILTEAGIDFESGTLDYAVVGIGINVLPPLSDFPAEIDSVAGPIYTQRPQAGVRSRLAAQVLNEFFDLYEQGDTKAFIEYYRQKSCIIGRKINVLRGEQSIPATALEITDDAALCVQYDDGTKQVLTSGEVSIRLR